MDNYNIDSKSCSSTGGDSSVGATAAAATTNSSSNRVEYLKHLNKLSHKISKPTTAATVAVLKKPPPSFDPPNSLPAQPQHQPPVYNINKSDFRDVVQKLTGSPAHENRSAAAAPQLHHPKPASSRLQRIRPPPLAHIANRPPPMLGGTPGGFRPPAGAPPLSPLPPLPAVHAAAESPVSAYMRYLHSSMASGIAGDPAQKPVPSSGFPPLAPLVSPRWSNLAPPQQGFMPQRPAPPVMPPVMNTPQFQVPPPSPPIPFGCLNSPRSPYPLLSPSLLLSPSSGQIGFPQLPISPTVPPMPSPTWRSF